MHNEQIESENIRLQTDLQRTEFSIKEIPAMKKRLVEFEKEIANLTAERDDLSN